VSIHVDNVSDDQIKASLKRLVKASYKRGNRTFLGGFQRMNINRAGGNDRLELRMFTEADLAPIIDRVIAANKPQIEKSARTPLHVNG
jgi:hypothetical protein